MTEIIVAIITGGLAFLGVVYSNSRSNDKIQAEMAKQQAVTAAEIKELTREVREHNNFAKRVPVIEEQIKVANHRIEDLEHKVG